MANGKDLSIQFDSSTRLGSLMMNPTVSWSSSGDRILQKTLLNAIGNLTRRNLYILVEKGHTKVFHLHFAGSCWNLESNHMSIPDFPWRQEHRIHSDYVSVYTPDEDLFQEAASSYASKCSVRRLVVYHILSVTG